MRPSARMTGDAGAAAGDAGAVEIQRCAGSSSVEHVATDERRALVQLVRRVDLCLDGVVGVEDRMREAVEDGAVRRADAGPAEIGRAGGHVVRVERPGERDVGVLGGHDEIGAERAR